MLVNALHNTAYQKKWYAAVRLLHSDFAGCIEQTFPANQAKLKLSRVLLQYNRYFDYLEKIHSIPKKHEMTCLLR